MFGAIIRGLLVLVAGAIILMFVGPVAEALSVQTADHADPELGDNSRWVDIVAEWYPLIILATVAAILVGSAIQKRRQVRV